VTCADYAFGVSRAFATTLTGGGPTYALQYLDIPKNDDGSSQYPGPYDATPEQQAMFDAAVQCDGNTITFHLANPIADFNYTVTLGFGAVPNPVDHPDVDTGEAYTSMPWSNGPYMIAENEKGVGGHLRLVRNPNYDPTSDQSGRMAYPDEWLVQYGIEPTVLDQRLMTPSGDDSFAVAYGNVQPENLGTIFADPHTANPDFTGRAFSDFDPYSRWYWVRTDTITNVNIRLAMAAALNRDGIRQNGGGEYVGDYADGFIKPNIGMDYAPTNFWTASGPFGVDVPETGDPDLAAQLIADSGEAAPTLDWNYISSPVADRTAGLIQDSLQRAGFTVNLAVIAEDYYGCVYDPDCQGSFGGFGWGPDWPNASTVIPPNFIPEGGYDIARVGMTGNDPDPARDTDFVDAVRANMAQTDRAAQAAEWQRLNTEAANQVFGIPTFFGLAQNLAGDKVGNLYRWGPYGSWPYGIMYVNNQ
jgi:peptide/nickel transport system substrate-binding protein